MNFQTSSVLLLGLMVSNCSVRYEKKRPTPPKMAEFVDAKPVKSTPQRKCPTPAKQKPEVKIVEKIVEKKVVKHIRPRCVKRPYTISSGGTHYRVYGCSHRIDKVQGLTSTVGIISKLLREP